MSQDLTARIKQLEAKVEQLQTAVEKLKRPTIAVSPGLVDVAIPGPIVNPADPKRPTITLKKT